MTESPLDREPGRRFRTSAITPGSTQIAAYRSGPEPPGREALASLREKGATDEELTELVRARLAEFLFHVCYLLSDSEYTPADMVDHPLVEAAGWGLEAYLGEVSVGWVDGLHESVLGTDPMRREVRPRDASDD